MPEGPEIKLYVDFLKEFFEENTVNDILIYDFGKLPKNYVNIKVDFKNCKVLYVLRHGKVTILDFSNGYSMIIHLGISGYWNQETGNVIFKTSKGKLCLSNTEGYGYIKIVKSINSRQANGLGPDLSKISFEEFEKLFIRRRKKIYSLLTDQKIISGIGNYMACEIFYEAKVSPHIPTNKVSKIKDLFDAMKKVYKDMLSIDYKSDAERLRNIKNHTNRNPKIYEKKEDNVIVDKINGRTIYWKNFN